MRKGLDKEYAELRVKYLTQHPFCRARLKGCLLRANQVHHKMGRIGDLLLNTSYWLPTCSICHDWIEKHPEMAKELGFSLSRLNKE